LAVRQVTDDAYVRGDITPLSAHIEGYVRRVPVDDFQRVKQGKGSRSRITTAQLAGPFGSRATGIGEPAAQGTAVLASIVRREAYVLAYIDAFWLIAWVSLFGILLVLLLRPPPHPLIPSRGA
jgi:hypothetical protein